VSDRGTHFASRFWNCFFTLLGVEVKLSTAFHPQTDGQTERVNQVLEQYLRCFIGYQQDDWHNLLPLAEFAYNNTIHTAIGCSPFFANYGYNPRLDLTFKNVESNEVPSAMERANRLAAIHKELIQQLQIARDDMKKYADPHRKEAPHFSVGDKVWLVRKNINTVRNINKLDSVKIGPYTITRNIKNVSYELALPPSMKIHNVFHVSLLEAYQDNTIPGRDPIPAPIVIMDGEIEYEVQSVEDCRKIRGQLEYLVHWKGYGVNDRNWNKASDMGNASQEIEDFFKRYPNKRVLRNSTTPLPQPSRSTVAPRSSNKRKTPSSAEQDEQRSVRPSVRTTRSGARG
jgi:hypothetical protein